MKSLKQLRKLRETALTDGQLERQRGDDADTRHLQRIKNKVLRYNWAIKYLERGGTEVFVQSEIERMETLITALMARFKPNEKISQAMENEFRRKHEAKYNIPHLRAELTNLRFLNSKSDD